MNIAMLMRLLARAGALAQRIPGIVYVYAFVAVLAAGAIAALIRGAEHRGAADATARIARAARVDSLTAIMKQGAVLALADSMATVQRTQTHAAVRAAEVTRATPSRLVTIVNDTSATVVTAAGADSTVAVAPQIITALRDRDAQITADSLARQADSTKVDTQAAKAASDVAVAVLSTRLDDTSAAGSGEDASSGDGPLAHVAKVTGGVVIGVVALVEVGRLVLHLLHFSHTGQP